MASRSQFVSPVKSLAQLLSECKDELKEFAATRISILRSEMRDKLSSIAVALPAIAIGALLALFALIFFSVALVAGLATLLGGGAGAWAVSLAIVGALFLIVGATAIAVGASKLKARSLKPERTLRVLQQDKIWLQNETRNQ